MEPKMEYSVVLTTTSNEETAIELAKKIITERLAACVQLIPIRSIYMWQGEMCIEPEYLLLIKTRADHYEALQAFISRHHAYTTPEILELLVGRGSPDYIKWIDSVIGH